MMHGLSTDSARPRRLLPRGSCGVLAVLLLLACPERANASLLSPELEDKLASFIAVFVLLVVPAVLIVLFWLVHILPEKIAHQRQHPQFEAIRTLCLLSLVFGGLLWPLAWIWAYSKPVLYKMAYGTDRTHTEEGSAHVSHEAVAVVPAGTLRERLARLEGRVPASELTTLRADLDALEAKYVGPEGR